MAVSAVQIVRAWLVASGSPVLVVAAAGDVRADRLAEGYDGTRGAVVLIRSAGGPDRDVPGMDEAVLSLRVYGTGTRVSCDGVVAAVIGRLHRVFNREVTGLGQIVSCEVTSQSDTVDDDFEVPMPMAILTCEVVWM